MDEQTEGRRARVRFGPKPHQTIPHEYAEGIFQSMTPKVFGDYLSKVVKADLERNGNRPDGHDG